MWKPCARSWLTLVLWYPAGAICTGQSVGLDAAQCNGWQALYDSTSGPAWFACGGAREDPCSCRVNHYSPITCKGGDITKMCVYADLSVPPFATHVHRLNNSELPNNRLEGTLPADIGQFVGLTNLCVVARSVPLHNASHGHHLLTASCHSLPAVTSSRTT
jgi:hypothetical protein